MNQSIAASSQPLVLIDPTTGSEKTALNGYVSVEKYNQLDNRLKELADQLNLLFTTHQRRFEYNGKCISSEIYGKNPTRWALKVVDHLFSEEELAKNTLEVTI